MFLVVHSFWSLNSKIIKIIELNLTVLYTDYYDYLLFFSCLSWKFYHKFFTAFLFSCCKIDNHALLCPNSTCRLNWKWDLNDYSSEIFYAYSIVFYLFVIPPLKFGIILSFFSSGYFYCLNSKAFSSSNKQSLKGA